MVQLIEKFIDLKIPAEERLSLLLAQLPNRLEYQNYFYRVIDPEEKWAMVRRVLEMVAKGEDQLDRASFLVFPEASIPLRYREAILDLLQRDRRRNTVTVLGFEHVNLRQYRQLLAEYRPDNEEAYHLVAEDARGGESERPVNWCLVAVKDDAGQLRCLLEAKTHPFFGEEFLDQPHDLYRGRYLYLFRSTLAPFNFIVLICLDYIYRDHQGSNILSIIQKANDIFYRERQQLDLLTVIQCNPKPDHQVFLDTAVGFYGEHLIFTPGVKNTTTVFVNTSAETEIEGVAEARGAFGHSALVVHKGRRLPATAVAEYSTDDLGGGTASRLRFGPHSRLYHLDLALFHERDPRTTRTPVKILSVHALEEARWRKLEGDEIISGVRTTFDEGEPW